MRLGICLITFANNEKIVRMRTAAADNILCEAVNILCNILKEPVAFVVTVFFVYEFEIGKIQAQYHKLGPFKLFKAFLHLYTEILISGKLSRMVICRAHYIRRDLVHLSVKFGNIFT